MTRIPSLVSKMSTTLARVSAWSDGGEGGDRKSQQKAVKRLKTKVSGDSSRGVLSRVDGDTASSSQPASVFQGPRDRIKKFISGDPRFQKVSAMKWTANSDVIDFAANFNLTLERPERLTNMLLKAVFPQRETQDEEIAKAAANVSPSGSLNRRTRATTAIRRTKSRGGPSIFRGDSVVYRGEKIRNYTDELIARQDNRWLLWFPSWPLPAHSALGEARRVLLQLLAAWHLAFVCLQLAVEPVCDHRLADAAWRSMSGKVAHLVFSFVYSFLALPGRFCFTVVDDDCDLSTAREIIAFNVRSHGFWFDLVVAACIPLDIKLLSETPSEDMRPTSLQWIMLLHCASSWRLFKPFRIFGSHMSFHHEVLRLIVWVILSLHCLSCCWALMAVLEAANGQKTWADQILLDKVLPGGEAIVDVCEDFYITALYFTAFTVTSVGYGDIVPANTLERGFAVTLLVISSMVLAQLIARLTWITSVRRARAAQHQARMMQVAVTLEQMGVSPRLYERILAYQEYVEWMHKERIAEQYFKDLSPPLLQELRLTMYHRLVMQTPFFEGQSVAVISLIVSSLHDRVYMPHDFIIRKGDPGDELFFIRSGQVIVLAHPDSDAEVIKMLETGSYFGEISVLTKRLRETWVAATCYCIVSVLRAEFVDQIQMQYPESFVQLVQAVVKVCGITPSVSWEWVMDQLTAMFTDTLAAFKWFCQDSAARMLSVADFECAMRKLEVAAFDAKLLWAELDDDASGMVSYDEFCAKVGEPCDDDSMCMSMPPAKVKIETVSMSLSFQNDDENGSQRSGDSDDDKSFRPSRKSRLSRKAYPRHSVASENSVLDDDTVDAHAASGEDDASQQDYGAGARTRSKSSSCESVDVAPPPARKNRSITGRRASLAEVREVRLQSRNSMLTSKRWSMNSQLQQSTTKPVAGRKLSRPAEGADRRMSHLDIDGFLSSYNNSAGNPPMERQPLHRDSDVSCAQAMLPTQPAVGPAEWDALHKFIEELAVGQQDLQEGQESIQRHLEALKSHYAKFEVEV